ncbi:MAG: hypothetical protein WC420_02705 [Candidatus Paceibacterota bacterium]
MLGEIIELYKPLFIGMFLLVMFIATLTEILSCRVLQDIPNGKENNGKSWCGPAKTSYVVAVVAWLISLCSVYLLLASTGKVIIVLCIAAMFSVLSMLMTTSILASIVIYMILRKNKKLLPTQNGRQSNF